MSHKRRLLKVGILAKHSREFTCQPFGPSVIGLEPSINEYCAGKKQHTSKRRWRARLGRGIPSAADTGKGDHGAIRCRQWEEPPASSQKEHAYGYEEKAPKT